MFNDANRYKEYDFCEARGPGVTLNDVKKLIKSNSLNTHILARRLHFRLDYCANIVEKANHIISENREFFHSFKVSLKIINLWNFFNKIILEHYFKAYSMEYCKINSIWKRHGCYFDQFGKERGDPYSPEMKKKLIVGDYACPEFANIRKWSVDEKVDGTNIRIFYKDGKVNFGGRTSAAQLPCHLLDYLQETFTDYALNKAFPAKEEEPYPSVILFGEGYGPKIQAGGGNYRKDPGFILFDVVIGNWWLKREDVKIISEKLNIPMVPHIGIMTENEIVDFVKSKPLSRCSEVPQMMEGVVCRSEPLMLFRNGLPIMWKLKTRDLL